MAIGGLGNHGLPAMYLVKEDTNTETGFVIAQPHCMEGGTVPQAKLIRQNTESVTNTNAPVV